MKRLLVATCLVGLAAAAPAAAATPVYNGSVGPGFTIKLAKPTKAGKVEDRRRGQVVEPQLPPHRPRREREDDRRRDGHEDVHRHPEEGHLQVRLRPAQERHEGVVHDSLTPAASGQPPPLSGDSGSIPRRRSASAASSSRRTE